MNEKSKTALKKIIEAINAASRTLDVRDYQVVLDELSGEVEARIDAIEQEHGMV